MMWEGGNYWTTEHINDVPISSNIHVPAMVHDIHVLLVDHESDTLFNTAKQLEMFHYKVTCAEHANHAATFLGKLKIDVVMANINFPDPNGFKLLQHAVNMCIPVVWMCDDENAITAMRALENGAFLCIRRPLTVEFTRCMWQLVIREKTRMTRDRDMLLVASNNLGSIQGGVEFNEVHDVHLHQNPNPNPNHVVMMGNKGGKYRRMGRGRQGNWYDGDEYDSDNTMMMNGRRSGNLKRKMCTEWTQELHAKFMDAVEQLGEGRCFPKEILELMNEPGLTRMQVASHLQKCRNDNWRSPEERRPTHQTGQNSNSIPQSKSRTFGSKPQGRLISQRHVRAKTRETGQSSGTQWDTRAPNDEPKMGHASSNITYNTPNHLGTNSNLRHASDEFFNFPDMDSLIHEFSSGHHELETNYNLSPTREGCQVDPVSNVDQNSGKASLKNKSQ